MKVRFFLAVLLLFSVAAVNAQDSGEQETISDDEIKRYAVMMDSIDQMRSELLAEISEMVKTNENISVARYNDLYKLVDNEAKLAELEATPQEIAAIKEVQARKDSGASEIQTAFKEIVKEYVGIPTYNKVGKAIKSDNAVKSKYEAMLEELKADNGG